MESSEIQKSTIKLGNALVKELGLKSHADTISRWMAYYIAEQMAIAEKAKGEAKIIAERKCFEAILKLWEHRSYLPAGIRPFESFDPIFRVLEGLDPENKQPYFYRGQDSLKKSRSGKKLDEIQTLLDIAKGIDQAARIWLEYIFHQAALSATDKKTITWLENAIGDSSKADASIIVRLLEQGMANNDEDILEKELQVKQEQLKLRIEQLDGFNDFNQSLREILVKELENLTKDNTLTDTAEGN